MGGPELHCIHQTRLPSALALGTLLNLWFLWTSRSSTAPDEVLVPARIFFFVSAYRCTFPCRYKNNIVLRDTPFSSRASDDDASPGGSASVSFA